MGRTGAEVVTHSERGIDGRGRLVRAQVSHSLRPACEGETTERTFGQGGIVFHTLKKRKFVFPGGRS